MAAFIEANGDGYYDEEGRLMLSYGGMDVLENWIYSLSLVDGQGVELFPEEFGLDVHGDKMAEFVYPALSPLPDEDVYKRQPAHVRECSGCPWPAAPHPGAPHPLRSIPPPSPCAGKPARPAVAFQRRHRPD